MSLINFDDNFNTNSSSKFPLTFCSSNSSISHNPEEHEIQENFEEDFNISKSTNIFKEKKKKKKLLSQNLLKVLFGLHIPIIKMNPLTI